MNLDEELRKIEERKYHDSNFRDEMSEFQMEEAGIPPYLFKYSKKDILPEHTEFVRDYILSFTVGEGRRNAEQGLILTGDNLLSMIYMSVILRRVFVRRRSVYCNAVFNLESQCKDRDRFDFLSNKLSVLGVYSFPFMANGLPHGRDDLLMTPFHQMIFNRMNNCLPTVFVSHLSLVELAERYASFPMYMITALQDFNIVKEIKRPQ
jgi:hypothetical protein